jgi:hypothetical protein
MRKNIVAMVLAIFIVNTCLPPSYAQTVLDLPVAGSVVGLSQHFSPVMIKGVNVDPENPMIFDFIVDPGQSGLDKDAIFPEATKLIKYFMAALAVPEDDLWVNLSPYEKDRIVPEALGMTELGRDMLAQDYLLKQVTASLIDPRNKVGKEFWDLIYKEAYTTYGTTDVPVDAFNKVWIMPAKAVVYVNKGKALVVESSLKLMLEEDYLAASHHQPSDVDAASPLSAMTKEILRKIVVPVLEKEVNEGKNFAPLRQVYNALVLAYWFRENFKKSVLHRIYAGRSRIKGVDVDDKEISRKIYAQYVASFSKGVYNYVKEEYDPLTQGMVPKKYFSGGERFDRAALNETVTTTDDPALANRISDEIGREALLVSAKFENTKDGAGVSDNTEHIKMIRAFLDISDQLYGAGVDDKRKYLIAWMKLVELLGLDMKKLLPVMNDRQKPPREELSALLHEKFPDLAKSWETFQEKTRKTVRVEGGFKISPVKPDAQVPPSAIGQIIKENQVFSLETGVVYKAGLGACIAVIAFDQDGKAVRFSHLMTNDALVGERFRGHFAGLLDDKHRFLVVRGPAEREPGSEHSQQDAVDAVSGLLGDNGAPFYVYNSADHSGFKEGTFFKMIRVILKSDAGVQVAYHQEIGLGDAIFDLEEISLDRAETPQMKNTGGIDLKAGSMNVELKGEDVDLQLPEGGSGMRLDDIEGLTPVIMNIIPVQNMSAYLSEHY